MAKSKIDNKGNIISSDAKSEIDVSVYKNLAPAQAEAWIDNNVTDLASAKTALKHMVRMLIALRNYVLD